MATNKHIRKPGHPMKPLKKTKIESIEQSRPSIQAASSSEVVVQDHRQKSNVQSGKSNRRSETMPFFPPPASSLPTFLILIFFLVSAALAGNPHVINIGTPNLLPSSLAWDPSAQHFLVGSSLRPAVSSVSDAGVIETLISDALLFPSSPVSAVSVDDAHRRLLVALSHPAFIASYDLRSPRPHRRIFAVPLPDPDAVPGGIAVDPSTGYAYITSSTGNLIWKVDLDGNVSVFSTSPIYGGDGLGGAAHMRNGFLLVVGKGTGKIFKVNEELGTAKGVLMEAAAAVGAMAARNDGTVVLAGGRKALVVKSQDGWGGAAVVDDTVVEEGRRVTGVAVREGRRVYVLVTPEEEGEVEDDGETKGRSRIEEIEWEREGEGEMVWGLVLLGLGLAYFLYWRFQMGQLATSMNKKRA